MNNRIYYKKKGHIIRFIAAIAAMTTLLIGIAACSAESENERSEKDVSENMNASRGSVITEKTEVPDEAAKISEIAQLQKYPERMDEDEARQIIQKYVEQLRKTGNVTQFGVNDDVCTLEEHKIEDSHELMNLQAFRAYNEEGRTVGHFLLCNGEVLEVVDSFDDTCVADVNGNGKYELISLFGFGSGIFRYNLMAYECSNPPYFSSSTETLRCISRTVYIPRAGYGKLSLSKDEEGKIHLLEHDYKAEDAAGPDSEVISEDYGALYAELDEYAEEDGYHYYPERLSEMPYDLWHETFVNGKRVDDGIDNKGHGNEDTEAAPEGEEKIGAKETGYDDNPKNANNAELPPELNASIAGTRLPWAVEIMDWNGDTNCTELDYPAADSFAELAKTAGELPVFKAESILEYDNLVKLDFGNILPVSAKLEDVLLNSSYEQCYGNEMIQERELKFEDDGNMSFGLNVHMALMLSSNSHTYTEPGYRGFRLACDFGDGRSCTYLFMLSTAPVWKESE